MQVSVVETLENGASFRFTVIFGRTAENEMAAAELLEYKPKNSQDYFMVLPKSAQLSVDEKQLLRRAEGIEVVGSLEAALKMAKDAPEIMIIGGAQIFELAMPLADRLYITLINHEFKGDTYFPQYEGWHRTSCLEPIEAKEGYTFQYCIFEKE